MQIEKIIRIIIGKKQETKENIQEMINPTELRLPERIYNEYEKEITRAEDLRKKTIQIIIKTIKDKISEEEKETILKRMIDFIIEIPTPAKSIEEYALSKYTENELYQLYLKEIEENKTKQYEEYNKEAEIDEIP